MHWFKGMPRLIIIKHSNKVELELVERISLTLARLQSSFPLPECIHLGVLLWSIIKKTYVISID